MAAHLVKTQAMMKIVTLGMVIMTFGVSYLVAGILFAWPLLWDYFCQVL